jgi:DNA-binding Xre family transcriptional regulator
MSRWCRYDTSIEEVNLSINNCISKWDVSQDDNDILFDRIIGLQLKKLRMMRKKTQTRVAKRISPSITFQQIQKYEKGTNAISLIKLLKICEYLDVDVDYFLKPFYSNNLKFNFKGERNYDYQEQRQTQ